MSDESLVRRYIRVMGVAVVALTQAEEDWVFGQYFEPDGALHAEYASLAVAGRQLDLVPTHEHAHEFQAAADVFRRTLRAILERRAAKAATEGVE